MRKALSDALAKVELLQMQVYVVDSLNVNVAEQDALIEQLQGLIKGTGNGQVREMLLDVAGQGWSVHACKRGGSGSAHRATAGADGGLMGDKIA